MTPFLERLGLRALLALEPEKAHSLSIRALKSRIGLGGGQVRNEGLGTTVAGLQFPNPLGLAAGYDKNAEVPDQLLSLGFGFVEVGTVTPLPQPGNQRPRIFRLSADAAVINRLGFNNDGHEAAAQRLSARAERPGIVGVNIGANKDSTDRIADYELGAKRFSTFASYLTVNVSSPNTPGLRSMQGREPLSELLGRVMAARDSAAAGVPRKPPVFLKIAPDLDESELGDIAAEVLVNLIDGVIVSNTTVSRPALKSRAGAEQGGLSGRPLFRRSTIVLAKMRRLLGPNVALIGVGGIDSAAGALEKIRAGADLVQLYTGLIYAGPRLPAIILNGMAEALASEGGRTIAELRDSKADDWAAMPL